MPLPTKMMIRCQEKTAFQRRVTLEVVGLAALAADQLSTCDSAAVALRPSPSAHLSRPLVHISQAESAHLTRAPSAHLTRAMSAQLQRPRVNISQALSARAPTTS